MYQRFLVPVDGSATSARGLTEAIAIARMSGGRTAHVIVVQAAASPADVIVVGTHGRRAIGRFMLGSDAEQVLRISPIPVLLVRSPANGAAAAAAVSPPAAVAALNPAAG